MYEVKHGTEPNSMCYDYLIQIEFDNKYRGAAIAFFLDFP